MHNSRWLLLLGLLLLPQLLWAQYTNVTAQVLDPNGTPYANCQWSTSLINSTGQQLQLGGFPLPASQTSASGRCDSGANLSMRLVDNNQLTPVGSQWKFSICANTPPGSGPAGVPCFNVLITITGASQNISTTLQAAAAVIPGTGGGGSPIIAGQLGQIVDMSLVNDPSGTTAGLLAKYNGSTLVTCGAADTSFLCLPITAAIASGGVNLCAPGTGGFGCWVQSGRAPCTFDAGGASGSSTIPHFVGPTTGGKCIDLGAGYPAGACWTGQVFQTVPPNQSGTIYVRPACSLAPAGYATYQNNLVSTQQFTKTNFPPGSLLATNNPGNGSTDVTLSNPFYLPAGTLAAPSMVDANNLTRGLYTCSTGFCFTTGSLQPFAMSIGGPVVGAGVEILFCDSVPTLGNGCAQANTGITSPGIGVTCADAGAKNCAGTWRANVYQTTSRCNVNSVSPAACGANIFGIFVVPTTTTSYTVNTTAVTANSMITLTPVTDNTGITGGPTCTAPASGFYGVSGRVVGTSFLMTLPSTAGSTCWLYELWN